ncbi:hypothetical protein BST13_05825 [Mycobacterium aquaticum]|uniref:Uncharacterized protein n=1 Tax=Mycobacterium aquaticum TaxID=1927124 RepID=A0A1X0B708_9MYCO|nr:hypothetical protein BST13_05825 [Mycobacterium aquaticum]
MRRTVEVTEDIRKLVAIGGAIVVAGDLDEPDTVAYGDEEAPEPADHTGVTESDPSGVTPLPTGDFAPVTEPSIDEPAAEDEPKARRSRRPSNGDG